MIPGIPPEEFRRINNLFNAGKAAPNQQKAAVQALQDAIHNTSLVSPQTVEELKKILKKELKRSPTQDEIETAMFGISLTMIFKRNQNGEELLDDDLKKQLQIVDVLSPKARQAIARVLSRDSKEEVDPNHKIVGMDIDAISMKTIDNDQLLYN